MRLKIVDKESVDFCTALGISEERRIELSAALDSMVKGYSVGAIQLVRVVDLLDRIAELCENLEEYSYCIVLHAQWQMRQTMEVYPGVRRPL